MTPWTVARQAPLSIGFSRPEYWSGLQFSSPGDLPNPGMEPVSPAFAGRFFTTEPPGKPKRNVSWLLTLLVEKVMAPHSNTLAGKIPWTEEPGRLQSMQSLRVGHD